MVNLFPEGRYRSKWYVPDPSSSVLCAIGIHGQWIYVDWRRHGGGEAVLAARAGRRCDGQSDARPVPRHRKTAADDRAGRRRDDAWRREAVLGNYAERPFHAPPEPRRIWSYADRLSYAPGETVRLSVCTNAKHYAVEVIRDG